MLMSVFRNPRLAYYVQQGEPETTSKCSKDQPPYLQQPCFHQEKAPYKWTLQPSQAMELLQEQENTENLS